MKVEQFEIPGLAQYAYIVSDAGEAVIVDPIRDIDRYTDYLTSRQLRLTHILETHIHADFAAGSVELAAATGAELALSAYDTGERFEYSMPHRELRNGDAIRFGEAKIVARHTPGHTPEHLSFLLYATIGAAEPVAMFTGDFLFAGSLGRPDLLGEAAKVGLAQELYRSITKRIADLHDTLLLYPGHGAGSLCGSGMSDRSTTTLGFERAANPYFNYDEDEFVDKILTSVPEMPTYYPRMKELNAKGSPVLGAIPGGKSLTSAEVAELMRGGAVVLVDLRRPEAFGEAHVPGAISLGAGQSLSLWAGWLLDAQKRIVLIASRVDGLVEESRRALMRVGLDNIAGVLPFEDWIEEGSKTASTKLLRAADVDAQREQLFLVDVRSNEEWNSGAIEGAYHIMLGDLERRLDDVPRGTKIVTVCGSGYRASVAASLLERAGYDVSVMDGGMLAWKQMLAAK